VGFLTKNIGFLEILVFWSFTNIIGPNQIIGIWTNILELLVKLTFDQYFGNIGPDQ